MCRKTISTPTGWPTAPPGVLPTTGEVTKRLSNGSRRRLYTGSCSNRPGPIIAPSNARWASLAFRSSRSIRVRPRRFAEATGKLAKTDRLDAAILARMGAMLELEARPARSELLFELKELYVAREALVKDRTAAKNRGKALTLSLLKRQNAQRLEQIDRQIATVEAAILQIVEADASLADRFAILISIPGVSNITAFALLIAMPELGSLEAGQAANLAGLAPIARQSGRWTGRSFIRGGRADVRQALYMPALVAARFNPDMKVKYAHLIQTGKPAKVALTAIMRKLVVLANALLKANRPWTPKTA